MLHYSADTTWTPLLISAYVRQISRLWTVICCCGMSVSVPLLPAQLVIHWCFKPWDILRSMVRLLHFILLSNFCLESSAFFATIIFSSSKTFIHALFSSCNLLSLLLVLMAVNFVLADLHCQCPLTSLKYAGLGVAQLDNSYITLYVASAVVSSELI